MKDRTQTLQIASPGPGFTLSAANREGTFSLADLLSRGPLILEFLRGTWWSNCRMRMAQLEPHTNEIAQLGANLVYIAAEKREGVWKPAKYLSEHPVSFPFLLDEDRAVTKAYGLYHVFSHDAFRIAHPATLVVDRDGMCRYIYPGDDQTDRAPIDDVLAAVEKL